MSRFNLKGYYIYVTLSEEEISQIPYRMRHPHEEESFMMLGNCEEAAILERITGEDLSCIHGDWFIIERIKDE